MTEIAKITVGGFTNIEKVTLTLQDITGLLSLNNYGKSNVFKAISFGLNFIQKDSNYKLNLMHKRENIPLCNTIAGKDFEFEITVELNDHSSIIYGFSFAWQQDNSPSFITAEYLRVRLSKEKKYISCIKRDRETCYYLSSPKGRCNTPLIIENHQLAINKLSNYDKLHYISYIKEVLQLKVFEINSLADPKSFFKDSDEESNYSFLELDVKKNVTIPAPDDLSRFLFHLMKEDKKKYNLFIDAITQLLPDISYLKPRKIEIKKSPFQTSESVPYTFSEAIYSVSVQDRHLNQELSINRLSDGSKRILYVILMAIAVDKAGVNLLMVEELENSIHPSLFQKLLIVLKTFADKTKILFTSHSPYLIQYIKPEMLYIGLPAGDGVARFLKFRKSKTKAFYKEAEDYGLSSGDYLFDLLIQDSETRKEKEKAFFEI